MKKIIGIALAFLPSVAFAQSSNLSALNNVNDVSTRFTSILNTGIQILIALAVVWIILNVVRYLIAGGDSETRKKGGLAILWGVVGLFVILSIWGLVSVLRNSFGTTDTSSTAIPQLPAVNSIK